MTINDAPRFRYHDSCDTCTFRRWDPVPGSDIKAWCSLYNFQLMLKMSGRIDEVCDSYKWEG